MIDLAKPMSGLLVQPLGSNRVCANFSQNSFSGHAVLQRDGNGQSEAVHQAADRRAFLGHGDEELARFAVGIEPDGDVALVSADVELVRDRRALFLQLVAHGARRRVEICPLRHACVARAAAAAASPFFDSAVEVPDALSGCDFLHPSR